jgi:hypothetical protein
MGCVVQPIFTGPRPSTAGLPAWVFDYRHFGTSGFAARIASLMNNIELHRYPAERFDVYVGQRFEEVSSGEAEFLHRGLVQNFPAKGLADS